MNSSRSLPPSFMGRLPVRRPSSEERRQNILSLRQSLGALDQALKAVGDDPSREKRELIAATLRLVTNYDDATDRDSRIILEVLQLCLYSSMRDCRVQEIKNVFKGCLEDSSTCTRSSNPGLDRVHDKILPYLREFKITLSMGSDALIASQLSAEPTHQSQPPSNTSNMINSTQAQTHDDANRADMRTFLESQDTVVVVQPDGSHTATNGRSIRLGPGRNSIPPGLYGTYDRQKNTRLEVYGITNIHVGGETVFE